MPKYIITAPRYVKQVGDHEPQYVAASPTNPAVIELPDGIKVDKGLRPLDLGEEALKPAHIPKGGGVMKAADAAKKPEEKKLDGAKRAADREV